ncbi:uncharacterized protein V2V93DRAFT_403593 [Kockiozyma suomiensis]|uniref:uncharacterized protein n=1 Tax=Kockiozyma suomiensis TaxID=1337062 RepID=UPI00334329B1
MARTILNILPTEILIQICLYLSRDELKALHRTNSTFHKLLASNEFWQAKIVYCLGQEGRSYALAIRQDPAFSLFTWDMVFLALFEQWKFSFEHGLAGWDFKYLGRRLNVRKNPLSTTHETSLDAIHPQLKQFHVARHIRLAPGTYRLQVHFSQRNPSQARHPNMGKRPSFENLRFNVYLYDDDLPHKTIIEPPRQSRLLNNPEFPRKLISSTALDSASSDLLVAKSWNAFVPIQVAEFYVTRGRHEMREWRTVLVEIAEDEGGDDDEKAPMSIDELELIHVTHSDHLFTPLLLPETLPAVAPPPRKRGWPLPFIYQRSFRKTTRIDAVEVISQSLQKIVNSGNKPDVLMTDRVCGWPNIAVGGSGYTEYDDELVPVV